MVLGSPNQGRAVWAGMARASGRCVSWSAWARALAVAGSTRRSVRRRVRGCRRALNRRAGRARSVHGDAGRPNEPVIGRPARRGQADVPVCQWMDVRAIGVGHHHDVLRGSLPSTCPEEGELWSRSSTTPAGSSTWVPRRCAGGSTRRRRPDARSRCCSGRLTPTRVHEEGPGVGGPAGVGVGADLVAAFGRDDLRVGEPVGRDHPEGRRVVGIVERLAGVGDQRAVRRPDGNASWCGWWAPTGCRPVPSALTT